MSRTFNPYNQNIAPMTRLLCILAVPFGLLVPAFCELRFSDVSKAAGVDFVHAASKTSRKYLIETMGAGVAVLDYDSDGLLDIYFVNGARLTDSMRAGDEPDKSSPRFWNRLYRNRGGLKFEDVTEQAGVAGRGYGMGVAVGDYDNDGDPDLFISNFGPDLLYRNRGDGTFQDVTDEAGISGGGWSAAAAFFDFDRDGLLDLFVARYLDWDLSKNIPCGPFLPTDRSYCHPRRFGAAQHILYRNMGSSRFADISEAAGLPSHPGKGLGVALGDFDEDGRLDVFVANDSYPQQLFRNVDGKKLQEVAVSAGVAYDADGRTYAGMGVAWSDIDQDGQADLFVNALGRQGYWLYRNEGGEFEPISEKTGLAAASALRSGWGTGLVDFDNDGWRDLFVAQGHVMDDISRSDPALAHREPFLLMRNVFGRFFDVSESAGPVFQRAFPARGAAFGDLDNDGRIDIVINVNDGPAVVLRNEAEPAGASLTLELRGTTSNRDAVGTRVSVTTAAGHKQAATVNRAGSYLSSSSKTLHFGLVKGDAVTKIEVVWPNGRFQSVPPVARRKARITETNP